MFNITLKKLREEANLSQYALAPLLKVSQSTIGNWESGIRVPDATMLCTIANFFNVSVDYLLGREKQQDEFIGQSFEVSEKKELSIRLKELRKQRNLTQQEMAQQFRITRQAYQRYENDTREPDIATLCKLADFFDVSVDYLLGRDDKPQTALIERPLGEIAENFIKEFKELLTDEYFLKFSKAYKLSDEKTRIIAVSYVLGYLQKAGINVSSLF